MRQFRYDVGTQLAKPRRTANGSLVVDAYLTRTGIFEYPQTDGSKRRELRLPDEVFHPAALDSLAMLPVTIEHPPEDITPVNARTHTVGTVGSMPTRAGDHVQASLVIFDADAIAAVEGGKRQLSVGYHLVLDEQPGVWRGERYDAIQREIRGNHLAIVDQGRAGPSACIRVDTKDTEDAPMKMVTVTINGTDYDVPENVAAEMASMASAASEADAKSKAATDAVATLEAQVAALKGEVTAAVGAKDAAVAKADSAREQADPAKLQALVKARVALETEARRHVDATLALDSMSDRAVREAVIKRHSPGVDLAKASDEYVTARYDAAVEHAGSAAVYQARAVAGQSAEPVNEETASAALRKSNQDAWSAPIVGARIKTQGGK